MECQTLNFIASFNDVIDGVEVRMMFLELNDRPSSENIIFFYSFICILELDWFVFECLQKIVPMRAFISASGSVALEDHSQSLPQYHLI